MAQKVTIEFTDLEDGQVGIVVSFDPPATDSNNSPAAHVAMAALQNAMNMLGDEDDFDDYE